jgi:hypothetical protein
MPACLALGCTASLAEGLLRTCSANVPGAVGSSFISAYRPQVLLVNVNMLSSMTFLTLDSVKASFTLFSLNRKVKLLIVNFVDFAISRESSNEFGSPLA